MDSSVASGSSVNSNGSIADSDTSKHRHDTAVAKSNGTPEGRSDVTAEDLALREDICYQIFGDVGALLRDFSCAWDHKVVMHGRMYVTERRLCFYANFFGLEAKMSLRHEDIGRCNKGNSAIFIPNVIVVQDKSGKDYVFRNFWDRDECHALLERLRMRAEEARSPNHHIEDLHDSNDGGRSRHGPQPVSPERSRRQGSRAVLQDSANGNMRQVRSPSPRGLGGRLCPVSPGQRLRSNSMPPSTLPVSPSERKPNASSAISSASQHGRSSPSGHRQNHCRQHSHNPTAYAVAAAAAAVAAGGDSGRLGLAILGGEHDIPPPCARHPHHPQRCQSHQCDEGDCEGRSPKLATVITGEGRGGWGSDAGGGRDSDETSKNTESSSRGGRSASASNGTGDGEPEREQNGRGAKDAGRRHRTGAGSAESEDQAGSEERDQNRGREGNVILRQASSLWRWTRDGGEAEVETEQRNVLEEAVARGRGGGPDHTEVATAEFPVSVREFYERFFADDAPYSLPDFHMSRGDWEVDATEWQATDDDSSVGKETQSAGRRRKETGAQGTGARAKCVQANGNKECGGDKGLRIEGVTRALRFKTPLHITFMSSPGQVRTLKRQRAKFFGKQGCVVDTITTVEDRIPLSDNFHVEDRWVIRAAGKDAEECTVTVSWRCVWRKFTVIKGLIEGKCRSDVQSFNISFLEGMREHLVTKTSTTSRRRSSSRSTRRSIREAALTAATRQRLSSFENPTDVDDGRPDQSSVGDLETEDGEIPPLYVRVLGPLLPAIRVLSTFFILYISIFWVRQQLWDGARRGSAVGGGSRGVDSADVARLYKEWGRSNLALLDLRERNKKLSSELLQFLGRGGMDFGDERSNSDRDKKPILQLLGEMESKVSAMADSTDRALESLGTTVSRLLDASTLDCSGEPQAWAKEL